MNNSNQALKVVKGFFEAINKGDFEEASGFMSSEHVYEGPMFSTNNPTDYFEMLSKFEMEFAVETLDLIAADNFVTHVSILKVLSPVQAEIPCCEVFDIVEGKITKQRFFFDTSLFPAP
ncbi:MAG: hypothetical protein COA49_00140 [Bacteroidetes bacterium]|nr:MAG: hypothetical protein COA49_00140 [Bacteroidota bacterium]